MHGAELRPEVHAREDGVHVEHGVVVLLDEGAVKLVGHGVLRAAQIPANTLDEGQRLLGLQSRPQRIRHLVVTHQVAELLQVGLPGADARGVLRVDGAHEASQGLQRLGPLRGALGHAAVPQDLAQRLRGLLRALLLPARLEGSQGLPGRLRRRLHFAEHPLHLGDGVQRPTLPGRVLERPIQVQGLAQVVDGGGWLAEDAVRVRDHLQELQLAPLAARLAHSGELLVRNADAGHRVLLHRAGLHDKLEGSDGALRLPECTPALQRFGRRFEGLARDLLAEPSAGDGVASQSLAAPVAEAAVQLPRLLRRLKGVAGRGVAALVQTVRAREREPSVGLRTSVAPEPRVGEE
mmetsp:Transcript_18421/g.52865  ORF Transcript_18421/g.52865 Transcript_18421/m.52865 type:complete len:350 (-) Transcript_18421:320-1369(-)